MNKPNRKNRTGPPRPQQRGRSAAMEGVYANVYFMHAVASQLGNVVQIQTKSGAIFEGVFYSVSPHFEIVLQVVHRVGVPGTPASLSPASNTTSSNSSVTSSGNIDSIGSLHEEQSISADSVFDVLVLKPSDVVFLKAKDVDLDYATRDTFQTDTAISKCNGSRFDEKELEPWQFDGDNCSLNGDIESSLELDSNANGWDVNDMFSCNEQRYGVQSTFDHSLTGYTMQIEKTDTQDFRDAEEQAEKIALEIESQSASKDRIEAENGDENEEAKYAAVERPQSSSPDEIRAGKYVAPGRRKQHNTQAGKLIRPSQLNNNSSNSNAPPVPVMSSQQNNNKYAPMVSHSLPPQSLQKNSVHFYHPITVQSSVAPQQSIMNRMHNPPSLQQLQISHKMNGEDQSGNDLKHSHHRRHRSDMDGDRNDRGDRIERERIERIDRDNRDNRDSRDPRDPRDPRDRENRDRDIRDNIRDSNKSGPPQRGSMRHYPSNQQMSQAGNVAAFSEAINNSNSNNQLLVSSAINQISSQSHQGPPQHQGPPPHQGQVRMYHTSPLMGQDGQPNVQHLVIQQQGPPPQQQRNRIQREEQTADFRKFNKNFILAPSKGQRQNEQNQSSQHPNQQGPGDMRSPLDENQPKPFTKPYANQVKQYPGQSIEPTPNAVPSPNPDAEKRPIQTGPPQLSKAPPTANTMNINQPVDAKVEQPAQSYVSVVQQQQQQQQPPNQAQSQQQLQAQKPTAQSQTVANVQVQNQQSSSPPAQQPLNRESERSTPNISESTQEYQSPAPQATQQQHVSNTSSSTSSTPPAGSTPQTPASANESTSSDKQLSAPKKYTLNPAAKPFTPRIPVTPNSSRPATPGANNVIAQSMHPNMAQAVAQTSQLPMHPPQQPTPQPQQMAGQHVPQGPQVISMAYFVQQQQAYPLQHVPQTIAYSNLRKATYDRKSQLPVSQVQVATAASVTGAPLHATPMAPYLSHYPQAHPQSFQGPYAPMVLNRYPDGPHQPQQLQYLTATPPSTTPSPGQPHQQQYHQGPQQSGSTPQYAQAAPQQFQVIPVMNAPPVVAAQYMQPPNSGPFLLMQPHPQQ